MSDSTDKETEAGDMNLGLEVGKGLLAKMIQAVLGFVGTVLFANILGPTSFGGFYILQSIVQIGDRPMQGISSAGKKRFSEKDGSREEILGAELLSMVALFMIAVVAALLFNGRLVNITGIQNAWLPFVILFAATISFGPLQSLLTARGLVGVQIWNDTLRSGFTTIFQLAFVLLSFGAAGMVYGLSLATFCCIPVTWYYLRTKIAVPSIQTVRSLWEFARYIIVGRILGRTYSRIDTLFLGYFISQAAAGYYEAAYRLTIPAMFLAVIAGSGVMAKISNLESQDKNIDKEITNTLSFTSMFAIPLFFGSLVLSRPIIITIYGPEYQASAPLLIGLSVYMVLQTQASPIQSIINGIDMPDIDMKVSAVTLVLNVVIGIPLVLSIGSIGVVIATVIAEGTRYGLFGTVLYQEKGISPVSRALLCQIVAGAIMFLVVKAAFEYLGVGSWIDLGIFLCIGGGVYFGVLTTIDSFFRQTFYAVFDDAITYLQLRFNLM